MTLTGVIDSFSALFEGFPCTDLWSILLSFLYKYVKALRKNVLSYLGVNGIRSKSNNATWSKTELIDIGKFSVLFLAEIAFFSFCIDFFSFSVSFFQS